MLSNSLNSVGATPGLLNNSLYTNPLTMPKQSTGVSGITLSPKPTGTIGSGLTNVSPVAAPTLGTNQGLLPGVNSSSQQKVVTTTPTGTTTTTHPAQSNPSVLAQQQMLNQKYGAGLVEDGIAGPKTSAAIAKYLSGTNTSPGSSQPSTVPSTASMNASANTIQPTKQQETPTFSGLLTSLSNQGGSQYNKTAQDAATSLQDISKTNPGNSGPAYEDYQKSLEDLNNLQAEIAKQSAGIESQPISMQFQQGKEQILARQNAALLDAAQQKVNEKAAALGYQVSGTQAQQSGLTSAGNLSLTGQSTAQNALGTAAGLAQPTTQFGVLTSPTTGNPINGKSAQDAAIEGGTIQGLQSGAQTSAAAGGSIAAQQATTKAGYQSALQQGQNLQSQVTDLIKSFGLNPSDLNVANAGLQKIAQNVSSPQYKILSNYINDIANTYAQILTPPGGSATDTTRSIATSMLDATANGESIIAVMKSLDQAAQAKIAGVSTTGNTVTSTGGGLWNW